MLYKVYFEIAGGKKLWINKEFNTKSDAEKELKIAEKEIRSAVQITNKGIVSTSPVMPKTVAKPKKTVKKPTEVPTTGLTILKFVKGNTTTSVGIAPSQLTLVNRALTFIAGVDAKVSISSTRMAIMTISYNSVDMVKITVPVKASNNLECIVDPDEFKKNINNTIHCLTGHDSTKVEGLFRMYNLNSSVKAQANAKSVYDLLTSHPTVRKALYCAKFRLGDNYDVTVVKDSEDNQVSMKLPLKKIAGPHHNVTSCYQTEYISGALKLFGSASVVFGMMGSNYPICISGINKGIKIEYLCAPAVLP